MLRLLPLVLLAACQPRFSVESAPELDARFERSDGWIGGDVAASVRLKDGRLLWLFGDTWIGKVREGRRVDAVIVPNTRGVMSQGRLSLETRPFIAPSGGFFHWPTGGAIDGRIFLARVRKTPGNSVFDFEEVGYALARAERPDEMTPVPFRVAAAIDTPEWIYLFGPRSAARARKGDLDRPGTWQPAAARSWPPAGLGSEFSVTYQPFLRKYVLVYTRDGLSRDILMRTAPDPEGPWSRPVRLYRAPEMDWDPDHFCSAAKAHPALGEDDTLVVSYVCNSRELGKAADSRLYRPRFVRIRFGH